MLSLATYPIQSGHHIEKYSGLWSINFMYGPFSWSLEGNPSSGSRALLRTVETRLSYKFTQNYAIADCFRISYAHPWPQFTSAWMFYVRRNVSQGVSGLVRYPAHVATECLHTMRHVIGRAYTILRPCHQTLFSTIVWCLVDVRKHCEGHKELLLNVCRGTFHVKSDYLLYYSA